MPENPYTSVTVSGYNASPPPDDGSTTADNKLEWDKHKTKLGDPLKTAIEAVDSNIASAFGSLIMTTEPGEEPVVVAMRQLTGRPDRPARPGLTPTTETSVIAQRIFS